jgi:phosphohistidine phosphatase
MKQLVLVRHAQADNALPGESDIGRMLTRRGMQDATEMARRLEERELIPQLIISSIARRAHSTAILLANGLHVSEKQLRQDERVYTAGINDLLVILQEQTQCERLMLVGHNPTITEFADKLSNERSIDAMPTCGIVTLQFDIAEWRDLHWHLATEVELDYPGKSP